MVGKARYKAKMFPPGPHGGCSRFSLSASGRNCQTSLGHCSYSRLRRLEEKGSTPMPASTKQQSEERATSATHASPEPAGRRATAGRTRDPGPSARPSVSAAGRRRGAPHPETPPLRPPAPNVGGTRRRDPSQARTLGLRLLELLSDPQGGDGRSSPQGRPPTLGPGRERAWPFGVPGNGRV